MELLLSLAGVMGISGLASPLLGVPRWSSLGLGHGGRLALLSHLGLVLGLCTLSFALSLALLSRLPPLLAFLAALFPGGRLQSVLLA